MTAIESPSTAIEFRLVIASLQHRLHQLDSALIKLPQDTPVLRLPFPDAPPDISDAGLVNFLLDVDADATIDAYLAQIGTSPHLATLYSRIPAQPPEPENPHTLPFVPAQAVASAVNEVERQAILEIEEARWPGDSVCCPYCGNQRPKGAHTKDYIYICANCYKKFHVFTATPFKGTRHSAAWWRKMLRAVNWSPRQIPEGMDGRVARVLERVIHDLPDWVRPLTGCHGATA